MVCSCASHQIDEVLLILRTNLQQKYWYFGTGTKYKFPKKHSSVHSLTGYSIKTQNCKNQNYNQPKVAGSNSSRP
jgi:hypothetical protein